MIVWDSISSDVTVQQNVLWTGAKGYLVSLENNNVYITLEKPGLKIGATIYIILHPDNPSTNQIRIYPGSSNAILPAPTSYYRTTNTGDVFAAIATSEDTWTINLLGNYVSV